MSSPKDKPHFLVLITVLIDNSKAVYLNFYQYHIPPMRHIHIYITEAPPVLLIPPIIATVSYPELSILSALIGRLSVIY